MEPGENSLELFAGFFLFGFGEKAVLELREKMPGDEPEFFDFLFVVTVPDFFFRKLELEVDYFPHELGGKLFVRQFAGGNQAIGLVELAVQQPTVAKKRFREFFHDMLWAGKDIVLCTRPPSALKRRLGQETRKKLKFKVTVVKS